MGHEGGTSGHKQEGSGKTKVAVTKSHETGVVRMQVSSLSVRNRRAPATCQGCSGALRVGNISDDSEA